MRRFLNNDRGVSALWVAVVALFLVGAAALAVDTSGAFNTAQTDQTTADLSCLAGVKELPDAPTAGIDLAVEYAIDNWPEMDGHSTSHTGTTGSYSDGNGSEIYVDAAHGGNASTMYVRITEVDPTYFGKAIGADSTTVVQEAACFHQEVQNGVGMLPIGALPGSWDGDLFNCAENKQTGNCGALSPNVPGGGGGGGGPGGGGGGPGADDYRDSVANGIVGDFIKHHGSRVTPDPDTGHPTINCFTSPCNVGRTEPGDMQGPWEQALTIRFDEPGVGCTEPGGFNCDSLADVLGVATPTPLGSAPAGTESELGWEDSLYGTFAAASAATNPDAEHYYFNGDTLNCDSPRLATVPIVAQDLDWDLDDGSGSLPNGRKDMKFIGFYTIYIREPSSSSDLGGAMDADILWFGPDTKCSDGSPFVPVGSTASVDTGVWLVSP